MTIEMLVGASVFAAMLRLAAPIALAALGGVMTERSGVTNIALEASMLVGAFFGIVAADRSGNIWIALGVAILGWTNPAQVRAGIGAVLVLYALYALARPKMQPVAGGPLRDAGIGFLNGILGGITGFAGIVVTIWCGLRGWPKDVQRAVFQPVGVATFVMCAAWLGGTGAISAHTVELFLLGLPFLLAGTWLGLKLYGRLDEEGFRKIVLALLLVSGVALLWSLR